MLHRLILAAALAASLSGAAQAQTTRPTLTATGWTDICVAPCRVKALSGNALLVVDTASPSSLTAPATVLTPDNGFLVNDAAGTHVYGLAQAGTVALSAMPAAPAGSGQTVNTVVQGTAVYRGLTIAANTSTSLMASNTARRGFSIQNQTTGNCGVKIGGAAATLDQNSLRIAPGANYDTPPQHTSTGAVAIMCAVAGGIYATEF